MERDRDWTAAAAAIEKQTGLETERERDKGLVEFSRWNQISHWLICNHERRRHSPFGKRQLGRQYNKEFQLSLPLSLKCRGNREREREHAMMGGTRKLFFFLPSLETKKKERSNLYQERQSKESRQGCIDSLSSSFVGLLRSLQKSQDGCTSPYGTVA